MSNIYGEKIKLNIFGESHSAAIGMTLEGIPAGIRIDEEALAAFMERRAPGRDELSTARKEADRPEFLCGIKNGITCGTPITAIIRNTSTRSSDYDELRFIPRPGHADYPAHVKFGGQNDHTGGGHFSGRLTAPLCMAGGIIIQILKGEGIEIISRIAQIGSIKDEGELTASTAAKDFPVVNDAAGEKMKELILAAKGEGDSVGGIIECAAMGLPVGVGDHIFGGMENRIAQAVFGIPAVKGIEFGRGFGVAELKGSENNDPYYMDGETVKTKTNNCGGILGGMTTGMPLSFRVAVKPTPSIYKGQRSVNLQTGEETELQIKGRHDPCIVKRAVPCVEAACAIAIYDALR